MKLTFLFLFCVSIAQAQLAPFLDFNGFFRTFYKDNFRQLEFQPIQSFEASNTHVAYIDMRGDFKIYQGDEIKLITNQIVKYKLSDGQLAWNISNALYAMVNGEHRLLSTFADRYEVSDSLVLFENTQYNTINVLYNGKTYPLMRTTGDAVEMPAFIGDNLVVFKDIGDIYRVFWRGQFTELGSWSLNDIKFSAGRNIACFNDPTHNTFAVFENNAFMDIEDRFVKKFKAGWEFCVYEDANGNLMHYQNGKITQLSNYGASFWDVQDNIVIWAENSYYYTFYEGEKVQLTSYAPADYKIKNDIIAFRNILGGVSAFVNGRLVEITTQMDAKYEIYSDLVLVELFNKSFVVYRNGRKFEA